MARVQDLILLRALKYEPDIRTQLARYVGESEVEEVLLLTYARLLEAAAIEPLDEGSIRKLALGTADSVARAWLGERYPSNGLAELNRLVSGASCKSQWEPPPFDSQRVLHALEALPASSREIIILHRLDRLTVPQLAHQLRISESEVNRRLSIALCDYARALFSHVDPRSSAAGLQSQRPKNYVDDRRG